jgi:CDP-glucose 4,6-dehydratase
MRRAYADRPVLVTGGRGFIGSWLVERLLREGARVVLPRRLPADDPRSAVERPEDGCELVRMDLLDVESVRRALAEHEVELVFHLAAQTVVGEANRSPLRTLETNIRGTYNLLEACRLDRGSAGERRLVIASSSHVYGRQGDVRYGEGTGLRASRPYDVSKACADLIARCYATTYGMPVAVTRLANVYGGGDRNWSRLVPHAARALVAGERPVIRSDGRPERGWLYVEDAVEVYLAVAASLEEPSLRGAAWNAGPERLVSVLELVRRLIAASGRELEPNVRAEGPPGSGLDRQQLDSTAIRERLGWRPRWSLEEGLQKTYGWYERDLSERPREAPTG